MIKKTCIEEIKSLLRRRKTPMAGGVIETAVSNVSAFKAGTVSRELRRWSAVKDCKENPNSLLVKSYFANPQGGSDCVEYILRTNSK